VTEGEVPEGGLVPTYLSDALPPSPRWVNVFIIGAARSGSTWLQALLGAHPRIATTVELSVFHRFVGPWVEAWQFEENVLAASGVPQGLRYVMSEAEFRAFLSSFVHTCYQRVFERRPGATHVLDKQPGYSPHVRLIDEMLPGARFIHLVRDGRDVAVSMRNAGPSMAFGPVTAGSAARLWAKAVRDARVARGFGDRYLEIKYEELLADTLSVLARIFDHCGVAASPEQIQAIVENYSFERMKSRRATADPQVLAHPRHYQRGGTGRWRQELSLGERYEVHRAAGDLLVELGYATANWWGATVLERGAAPLLALGERAKRRIARFASPARAGAR